ncbi:bifunctional aspartate kinase/homoserine dehydrogenase I [Microscilla marina]|uniref:Bifunctional aspartokinase/homoserine dehydrogenase 1, (Ak-hd 1) (Ak-hsdh 1) n=1 Tax=Microscilla marina ATCC 23134 TaxID=313606 RepID=A1ZLX2_MICM2|nr:bifunctional aspartate kinase/homoserine dehydrogenase I [Microscilla marina]EAY28504.1 bifunctional aspartokinase/homoserine dehydrogenase 1, (ak-hd 1) (ak-hsdh 1) [Microscilla marina ATCC 23134]
MKVLKFGGTSVGSPESIKSVKDIVRQYQEGGQKIAVVVSALKGTTNALVEMGQKARLNDTTYQTILTNTENHHYDTIRTLIPVAVQSKLLSGVKVLFNEIGELLQGISLLRECSPRTLDMLLSFGERLSSLIVSEYLKIEGIQAVQVDARQLIETNDQYNKARVNTEATNQKIRHYFDALNGVAVVTGFIAATAQGDTTTLGRGGSDYTAAILGAALYAKEIEIWTDVDGMMTADPRVVKRAFSLEHLSYEEAMELSHFGAKIIYPPTLQPAISQNIPLRIKNTFNPDFAGTLIGQASAQGQFPVKGISSIAHIALLRVSGSGMVGVPGVSSRIFGALAQHQINIVLISQASSEHSICFAVAPEDAKEAKEVIEEAFSLEIQAKKVNKVSIEQDLSVVAIIGEHMRRMPGISGNLFTALGNNGINVVAIAQGSSELNVSTVIATKDLAKALNALHEAFFLSNTKTIHIFMLGAGLIGNTLLHQLHQQKEYLLQEQGININLVALANSKKMRFDENGLDISLSKDELLATGETSDTQAYINKMKALNLPNSIFVDCTAAHIAIDYYEDILKSSISIATPNKLANSADYLTYQRLKQAALLHGVKFLYETNVGAGLPVINTLNDLQNSGDKIHKIEGVLSGTLSYIFNNFDGSTPFSEIVKDAKNKGLTEPDPRDDLNGQDVARKILILAREVGWALEPDQVQVENILPQSCLDAASVEQFFDALEQANGVFQERVEQAAKEDKKLRLVAVLENGEAKVKLEAVDSTHPFYTLRGSDNMIAFTSQRYQSQPLVIRGPGAGADVTAAGVFAEIISVRHYLGQSSYKFNLSINKV